MINIDSFIGNTLLSVSEAMALIDNNSYGILFLTDENKKLLACITDGDIRRFLLAGGKTDDKAFNAANKNPRMAFDMDEAKGIYHSKNYIVVPVVNENRVIVDLYCGNTTDSDENLSSLNVPVVINAGGKGTRLEPFTKVLPKPLIPVGELPIIELIMKQFQKYNCNQFSVIVNYKRDLLKAYFYDSENNYDITWYDETIPLGTGGGLGMLKGKVNETFFFSCCDTLLTIDYAKALDYHRNNKNVITMICANKSVSLPYGIVETDTDGTVKNMTEKPVMSFSTNTGVYIVEPEVLKDIEGNVSISFPEIIERQRKKGRRVSVYHISENDWLDMGQISELGKMRKKLFGE